MTEITLNKTVFLKTLDALHTQFQVEKPEIVLQSDGAERFILTAKRPDNMDVRAFGPCTIKGGDFSIEVDMQDLQNSIEEAFAGNESDELTLMIANGIWVKDPSPAD